MDEYDIPTGYERGRSTLDNDELLDAAEREGFEVLVTADRNLRHQQDLRGRNIAIVVLTTTSWPRMHLREMMSRYSAISEGFPSWLKGPKSVLATLCADGVLVTHWEAPRDIFAFGTSLHTVTEIADAQSYGPNPLGPYMSITLNLKSTDWDWH